MTAGGDHQLSLRAVFREINTVYRRHWAFLVPAAIVVLLPPSILDATLDGSDVEGFRSAKDIALFGAVLLTVAVNLGGQAIYAGLTAAADVDWRAGRPLPPLSTLIRSRSAVSEAVTSVSRADRASASSASRELRA